MERAVLGSILIAGYWTAYANELNNGPCSGKQPLLDKAMVNYLTLDYITNMTIPSFNLTKRIGWVKFGEFYGGSIKGLYKIKREGNNYVEANNNQTMRMRIGLTLESLNISIDFRLKNVISFMGYTKGEVQAYASALTFILEIKEISGQPRVTGCTLKIRDLHARFILKGKFSKLINSMGSLQKYITKKLKEKIQAHSCYLVNKQVTALGQRMDKESKCSNCRKVEVVLRNAVVKYGLDPAPLSSTEADLFGNIATVKVNNGTLRGLSTLRRSGDFLASMNDCGARLYADVAVNNLTVTLSTTVEVFWTPVTAIVSISLSTRIIVDIVERNSTLMMEKLVVNITEPVDVDVTPIGSFSSLLTSFLPEQVIAAAIPVKLPRILNNTIHKGIKKLRNFAQSAEVFAV